MADVTVAVNGYEYSEEEFKKDLTRMFDTYRGKDDSTQDIDLDKLVEDLDK